MRHIPARALRALLVVGTIPLAAGATPAPPVPPTQHLVVISVDGLRPDAITTHDAPTMRGLMREGSYSRGAMTILPSKTLPSHTSMVTGVEPEVHGITWNDDRTLFKGRVQVPTMFGEARRAGLETAAFFSKSKFRHLVAPGTLDHVEVPSFAWGRWRAERTVHEVEQHLAGHRPNLVFVHFGEPDYAGHEYGWMTEQYGAAVGEADRAVARVLAAAERSFGAGNYTVILTADHGGSGYGHGSADPLERTIPWITWGKGVAPSAALPPVHTTDTAATSLWLLGLEVPRAWTGTPVAAAYEEDPVPSAPLP